MVMTVRHLNNDEREIASASLAPRSEVIYVLVYSPSANQQQEGSMGAQHVLSNLLRILEHRMAVQHVQMNLRRFTCDPRAWYRKGLSI